MRKSYPAAKKIVLAKLDELKKSKKIRDFCLTNGLEYQQVINFKNTEIQYHTLLLRLLDIFGYTVVDIHKETFFEIEKKSSTPNNNVTKKNRRGAQG